MTFSEKLTGLRRKSGMSQEQLADRLGVTRQSVSKWEGGTAMPELVKLISLSELFGVSVDYLVKDWMEEPDNPCGGSGEISSKQAERLEKKVDELTNYVKGRVYRYDSKTRIFGLPLVSIRFGFVRNGKLSMDNTALENHLRYLQLMNDLFLEVNPIPVKAAMNMMGLDVGPMRLPLCEMGEANAATLRRTLEEAGLL